MTLLIKNGHVLDPATETDEEIDIFIEDGKIAKRGKKLKCKAERVIRCGRQLCHAGIY